MSKIITVKEFDWDQVVLEVGKNRNTLRYHVYGNVYISIRCWGQDREWIAVNRAAGKYYEGKNLEKAFNVASALVAEPPKPKAPTSVTSWDGLASAQVLMRENSGGGYTLDVALLRGDIVINVVDARQAQKGVTDGSEGEG